MRWGVEQDDVDPPGTREFVAYYEQHYGAVLAYLQRRVGAADARDVAAEVFLVAWRRLDEAQKGGPPWLYRTAALTLLNARRSASRRHRTIIRIASLPTPTTAGTADGIADWCIVLRALASLSDADQEILMLAAWEDLTSTEIAQALAVPSSVAKVRLHRARTRLRSRVNDMETGRGTATATVQPTTGRFR
jgi:RNA polymerase sigma factor (sigma-70 family)